MISQNAKKLLMLNKNQTAKWLLTNPSIMSVQKANFSAGKKANSVNISLLQPSNINFLFL